MDSNQLTLSGTDLQSAAPLQLRRDPINLVRVEGLEPPRHTTTDSKSAAAANYAIPALNWWIPEESNPDLSLFRRARTPATPEIHVKLIRRTLQETQATSGNRTLLR